jgi:hypothetical protein
MLAVFFFPLRIFVPIAGHIVIESGLLVRHPGGRFLDDGLISSERAEEHLSRWGLEVD